RNIGHIGYNFDRNIGHIGYNLNRKCNGNRKFKLNNLDVSSWWEVVEERFLSHLCGFPTCSNTVEMKPMSIYRIDRKQMKASVQIAIFERCTEKQKFCSKDCFLRSAFVLSQLAEEPLWIRGYRQRSLSVFFIFFLSLNAVCKKTFRKLRALMVYSYAGTDR
uniref:RNA polymerase II subunit B1 CTD phosphatase RPAP2 homolog n=1 Tax=Parascaris equorum TaxID=6256 RepID=A0A914RH32_PAREQ